MKSQENIPSVLPLQFETNQIRIIQEEDELLFVAIDIASALGYKRPNDAIQQHCKGAVKHRPLQTHGGIQNLRVIYEPDLYRLIVGSQLASAQKFEAWIFEEVLPAIRKTGSYTIKDGPYRNAFDASIAKRHSLGMKTIRDSLKMSRDLGLDLYEARVSAVNEGTKISGIDFSHYIPHPKGRDEESRRKGKGGTKESGREGRPRRCILHVLRRPSGGRPQEICGGKRRLPDGEITSGFEGSRGSRS